MYETIDLVSRFLIFTDILYDSSAGCPNTSSFVYLSNKTAHLPRDEEYCIFEIYFRLSREDYVFDWKREYL